MSLLEGSEGGGGLAFEAELGAQLGPVEFEGGGALGEFVSWLMMKDSERRGRRIGCQLGSNLG